MCRYGDFAGRQVARAAHSISAQRVQRIPCSGFSRSYVSRESPGRRRGGHSWHRGSVLLMFLPSTRVMVNGNAVRPVQQFEHQRQAGDAVLGEEMTGIGLHIYLRTEPPGETV